VTRWPRLAPYLAAVLADIGDAMLSGEWYEEPKPWEDGEFAEPSNPVSDFGSGE
jgi:hypothetical protein